MMQDVDVKHYLVNVTTGGADYFCIVSSSYACVKIDNKAPGKVIFVAGHFPVVVCGEGLLILKDLRSESGKSMLSLPKFRSKFQ